MRKAKDSMPTEQVLTAEPDQIDELVELVGNIDQVVDEVLPEDERKAYDEAQQSIVEARRSAETHEGLLQLH